MGVRTEVPVCDVLVIGAGPAALAIAAALAERGVAVRGVAPLDPASPWANTYGIWGPEVDALGVQELLEHRWSDCRSDFRAPMPSNASPSDRESTPLATTFHGVDYGLFDRARLQRHWLESCRAAGMVWDQAEASAIAHDRHGSCVSSRDGRQWRARLVIDASGHQPVFVRRPDEGPVAGQAAYGIVGTFTAAPVEPGQFVLMDYRSDHLSAAERQAGPPTFLYAMDLGDGRFFVEETSLALAPPVPYAVLQERLMRRLAHRGVGVAAVEHEEFCLFPMNTPLPDLSQQVVGFGGAASLVHPASGYMVGSLLRRAPALAQAITEGLLDPALDAPALAQHAWRALWPLELRRKHALYRFGLEKLMRYPEDQLRLFFRTFFSLPTNQWYGFLTNTLSLPELIAAMLRLFAVAPWSVRFGLMQQQGRELQLLLRLFKP